jgi:hypothetical protein
MGKAKAIIVLAVITVIFASGCTQQDVQITSRYSKIPAGAEKVSLQSDVSPPKSLSQEFTDPVPVPGLVNSAGAEDSGFVMPDGSTLYFFFTPDVSVPAEKQVLDGVTGIYVSHKEDGVWGDPERVLLQDPGKLALDGCEFVQGNAMLFCSAREGYTGIHWFSAESRDGKWQGWGNADFNPDYKVGELHISGDELYFHSDRPGGKGGLDIWVSRKVNGEWQSPENLEAVNSPRDEGWPFVSQDGSELWISRDYGLWRSSKADGAWNAPELMISPLAGEASLDSQGNVYFTHHFYRDYKMIEADIYFARRK